MPAYCAFVLRTTGDPHALIRALRERVAAAGSDQVTIEVETLDERLDNFERAIPLFLSTLFTMFGTVALTLAITGVYSVVSYGVARRTHEVGIRMALGARPADVLKLVLGGAMRLLGTGLLIGTVASVAITRSAGRFLQDWNPKDPFPLATVIVILIGAGLTAAWVPARRATRIEPSRALRHD
jgi:ABC-type antimicrobial peptide transport system permease subunit